MPEPSTDKIRKEYPVLAVWRLDDGSARYTMLGRDKEDVEKHFRKHLKDVGMDEEIEIESLVICRPDKEITIRYSAHDQKVTLTAKEWAAVFDPVRPDWNIIGCSEWE